MRCLNMNDINAIKAVDHSQGIYLHVVGKGDDCHLEARQVTWWGRFLIKIGHGSASIAKITDYMLNNNISILKNPHDPSLDEALLDKLEKIKTDGEKYLKIKCFLMLGSLKTKKRLELEIKQLKINFSILEMRKRCLVNFPLSSISDSLRSKGG
jgi:hypothetical protein